MLGTMLLASMGSAHAATTFDLSGTFQMRDPSDALMQHDETIANVSMVMDYATGRFEVNDFSSDQPFFGVLWTAHEFSM